MAIILSGNPSWEGDKTGYTFAWGKGQGQRNALDQFLSAVIHQCATNLSNRNYTCTREMSEKV